MLGGLLGLFFVSWKLASALLLIMLPAILQLWTGRLACYAAAAFALVWAAPMAPEMARAFSSGQSGDAMLTSTVFFLCLFVLGLIVIAGAVEVWSWILDPDPSSDMD